MHATMTKEIPAEIFSVELFVDHVNREIESYWKRCNYTISMPIVRAEILSDKWIRLNNKELRDGVYKTTSVYCFIARQTYSTREWVRLFQEVFIKVPDSKFLQSMPVAISTML